MWAQVKRAAEESGLNVDDQVAVLEKRAEEVGIMTRLPGLQLSSFSESTRFGSGLAVILSHPVPISLLVPSDLSLASPPVVHLLHAWLFQRRHLMPSSGA